MTREIKYEPTPQVSNGMWLLFLLILLLAMYGAYKLFQTMAC